MGIVLGRHSYGKAEIRVVRVLRDSPRHRIVDRTVTTSLRGDFGAAYTHGDQSRVLPTDSQKNTVYALARDLGDLPAEEFALAVARHFVDSVGPVDGARVTVAEHAWDRVPVDGRGHDHTFVRRGGEARTAMVTVRGSGARRQSWVVSGVTGLAVLKSTGSEFHGFLTDEFTTLAPTTDRIMATTLLARWRHTRAGGDPDWNACHADVRATMLASYARLHSLALQQTLWELGRAVLAGHPELAEIRLVAPNLHHFLVDLSPFGRDNPGEVFHADDRPYGLITATVCRDDVPAAEDAWDGWPGADQH